MGFRALGFGLWGFRGLGFRGESGLLNGGRPNLNTGGALEAAGRVRFGSTRVFLGL